MSTETIEAPPPDAFTETVQGTLATHKPVVLYLFLAFPRGGAAEAVKKLRGLTTGKGAAATDTPSEGDAVTDALDLIRKSVMPHEVETFFRTLRPWRETLSFTWRGLKEGFGTIDTNTLNSFPACFREGMAARAELLGDTGNSAPAFWDGALGDRRVHALLTLSSEKHTLPNPARRQLLRARVHAFNGGRDQARGDLNKALKPFGFEILHIEVGETPYDIVEGKVADIEPRVEHFGFRDGISQPFVVNTKSNEPDVVPTPPGGGRPLPDGSWAPVAKGELFLGHRDEDGGMAVEPANTALRQDGTYLVFRKLEQDIVGFRAFLKSRRLTKDARERLAAQMMGRWPNGTSVVESPDYPGTYEPTRRELNDFRYEDTDPHGLRCPAGAHVRRANPRDFRDGEAARRHRLLRRGTSYGGSLVRDEAAFDGEPRGLHFVALNARIDQQFEFVQREWMNAGEIFGRAGLGRCPITGASEALPGDMFSESGRMSADAHLPRFVSTRGGDYFFVPGTKTMDLLIAQHDFPFETSPQTPAPGEGSVRPTPELTSPERLENYGKRILAGEARTIRVGVKPTPEGKPEQRAAFLARYDDVVFAQQNSDVFGEQNYRANADALWGENGIIGMKEGSAERATWADTLYAAYQQLAHALCGTNNITKLHELMSAYAAEECATIVARVTPVGRIDLLQDLGFYVPYAFAAKFFGVAGPNWLTQVAVASRFARYNVMEVPKQWLEQAPDVPASLWPYLTMQTWMRLSFIDIIANVVRRAEITAMARQAIREYSLHIDQLIARERLAPTLTKGGEPATLLACLVAQKPNDPAHLKLTRLIITDLMAPLIVNVGAPFARILEFFLDDLGSVPDFRTLDKDGLNAVINEALRLKPSGPVQFRILAKDQDLPVDDPISIKPKVMARDIAVLMSGAAHRDSRQFKDPNAYTPGRPQHDYLNFGGPKTAVSGAPPKGGWKDADGTWTAVHHCWGERIGLLLLREMLKATSQLPLLRRMPGLDGETVPLVGVPYNLKAKFSAGPT